MSSESSITSNDASPASTAPSSILDEKVLCPISTDNSKFRPGYHLQPRTGWLNDPCAPGYDHRTKLYHLSFQHNPNGPDWGDICWSSMTSPDLIHWTIQDEPTLSMDEAYDAKGVFTGCLVPTTCLDDDEPLTVAYTSVSALPIHHTLPHLRGSESLSLAQSFDHGKTWVKTKSNPILPSEPENLDVTGWRDPFVAPWPSMCQTLGLDSSNTLFGIISGGIRNDTPTTFLYSIDRRELSRWNYLGPLTRPGLNYRPSRWSGDFGRNWEVTNFMILADDQDASITRDFLVMGTEGCNSPSEVIDPAPTGPSRPVRGQLWMAGSLQKKISSSEEVEMSCNYTGILDHGCLYAANSFFDHVSQRQIVWGWVTEEDLCDELRHAQGWSGLLSLPRELFLQILDHVTGTIGGTALQEITSLETEVDQHGSYTVRTLASRPVPRVVQHLRQSPAVRTVTLDPTSLNTNETVTITNNHVTTKAWELDCSFQVSPKTPRIGIRFLHSACRSQTTELAFHPTREEFTIHRPSLSPTTPTVTHSSRWINSTPESAPHTLFTLRDPATGTHSTEPLHIQMWRDNSVMEVFVNGRTAITSRLYAAESTLGIEFFSDEDAPGTFAESEGVEAGSVLLSAVFRDGVGIDRFVDFV